MKDVAGGGEVHRGTPSQYEGGAPVAKEARMARADDRSEVSVVGRGARIEGTVVAAGSLRVEGEVRGAITAKGDVLLSPEGRVEANIEARSITLAGQVRGDLTAEGDVVAPADGTVALAEVSSWRTHSVGPVLDH